MVGEYAENELRKDFTTSERVAVAKVVEQGTAKLWMLKNARARRNLNPNQLSYFRGEEYNLEKRQGSRTDLTSGQNVQKSTTAERLAEDHGVDEKTVRRDGEYAAAVDAVV